MLKKSYSKTGKSCRVTFKLDAEQVTDVQEVAVLGEFNSWEPESNKMTRRKDGTFSTTMSLDAGREYRFRYLLDGERWENDTAADSLAPNRFGTKDCVLEV